MPHNKIFITPESIYNYNSKYDQFTIVKYIENHIAKAYLAIKNVPPFTPITDKNYWKLLGSDEDSAGTAVVANPSESATSELLKLKIGDIVYDTDITKKADKVKVSTAYNSNVGVLPNIIYKLGKIDEDITLTFTAPTDNTIVNIYTITFYIGTTVPTITWSMGWNRFVWYDGEAPSLEANTFYEISVMEDIIFVASVPYDLTSN